MLTSQPRQTAESRGFTLIELLVVIGIIIVLAGIGLTVGRSVIAGGQKAATADTIRLLENASYDYAEETGANPSSVVDVSTAAANPSASSFWPVADAADTDGRLTSNPDDIIPSTALFLLDMRRNSPGSYDLVSGIDPKLSGSAIVVAGGERVSLPTILDAFGNPIRFVHPAYDGGYGEFADAPDGQRLANSMSGLREGVRTITGVGTGATETVRIRRSFLFVVDPDVIPPEVEVDADEGICRNDRPYFYSAGSDADPGTLIDNIYSDDAQPTFPYETFGERIERKASGRVLSGSG